MKTDVGNTETRPVALITGGTRGIGLAISEKLCRQGFDVAVNGVREEADVAGVLKKLRSLGGKAVYCRGDIGTAGGREAILKQLRSEFGRLNLLVNNAGVAPKERKDILEVSEESYEQVMRINLQGPWFLTQAVAKWMIEQKEKPGSTVVSFNGMIINIGSISATVISPSRGEYCLSKAGVAMHSKLWAVRLAEFDIPVYEVRPGVIKTDMTEKVQKKYDELFAEGLAPQARWGTPDDVAKAVGALASGAFPYSTGDVFMVDGGLTLKRL